MRSALQTEPDLNPSFENKVQSSFHAPPWLLLGPSFRVLNLSVQTCLCVTPQRRQLSSLWGRRSYGAQVQGMASGCPGAQIPEKQPTQGEQGLLIFIV